LLLSFSLAGLKLFAMGCPKPVSGATVRHCEPHLGRGNPAIKQCSYFVIRFIKKLNYNFFAGLPRLRLAMTNGARSRLEIDEPYCMCLLSSILFALPCLSLYGES